MTPSSDTSSPASCPPSPSHRYPIFAAQIGSSSQDSVHRESTYPYDDHAGMLNSKQPTGWNSVDTFEIRQGDTRKAVLISPTKFTFKLGRTTSPGSPTKSVRKRTSGLEKEGTGMVTEPNVKPQEEAGREIVRERVSLVDGPVSLLSVEAPVNLTDTTAPIEESPRLRSDQCAWTASGSRFIESIDHDVTAAEIAAFLQVTSPSYLPHSVKQLNAPLRSARAKPARPFIRITSPLSSEAGSPTELSARPNVAEPALVGRARSRRAARGSEPTRPRTMFGWAAAQAPQPTPLAGSSALPRPVVTSRSSTTEAVLTMGNIKIASPAPASPVEDRRFSFSGAFLRPRPASMVSTSSSISSAGQMPRGTVQQRGEQKQQKRPMSGLFRRMSSSQSNKAASRKPVLLPSPREEEEPFDFTPHDAKGNTDRRRSHGGLEPQTGWKRFMRKIISPNEPQPVVLAGSRSNDRPYGTAAQVPEQEEVRMAEHALETSSSTGPSAIGDAARSPRPSSWSSAADAKSMEAPSLEIGSTTSPSDNETERTPVDCPLPAQSLRAAMGLDLKRSPKSDHLNEIAGAMVQHNNGQVAC